MALTSHQSGVNYFIRPTGELDKTKGGITAIGLQKRLDRGFTQISEAEYNKQAEAEYYRVQKEKAAPAGYVGGFAKWKGTYKPETAWGDVTPTALEYTAGEKEALVSGKPEGLVGAVPKYKPLTTATGEQYYAPGAPQFKPTTVATSDQLRAEQTDEAKPYVKYADSDKVFDREGQHITAEKAAKIPDFWKQVQMKGEVRPEGVSTPVENIRKVFGENWQPAAAFTPEIQAQGVYGAVKVGDSVYTLGPGGSEMSPESYKAMFGRDITDTAGVAGEIDVDTAMKLGINLSSTQILAPIDPLDVWETLKSEGKADRDKLQTEVDTAMKKLIESIKGFGETKATAKEEAEEKLDIDEKSQSIADAQKVRDDHYNMYTELINEERFRHRKSSQILGRQAKIKSQRAIEMAPLDSTLFIAQGNYDRAMESLDDWSDDYNESMQYQLQAAQMNIDMVQGSLDREQQSQLADAQIKFNMWQADYERNLETQQEVKKLMLMYPEAGVTISDSWDDAYRKISPYVSNEKDFEQSIKDLEKQIKEKSLLGGGTTYAPSASMKLYNELGGQTGTGQTFNEWYKSQTDEGTDTPITFQSAMDDTADLLKGLRESGRLTDMNYKQAVSAFMADFGYDYTSETEYGNVSSQINQLMA